MEKYFKKEFFWLLLLAVALFSTSNVFAVTDEEVSAAIAGGQNWLINDQAENGSWTDDQQGNPVATTALVVAALLETGMDKAHPAIVDGIDYIKGYIQNDGGIYDHSSRANYINACALMALSLYGDPDDADIVQNAVDFTLSRQVGINGNPDQMVNYGGWSYSNQTGGTNADMSNTQFAVMGLWYASRFYLELPASNTEWADRLLFYLERSHGWQDSSDQAWTNGKTNRGQDGAFSYRSNSASFYPGGSMTGAGIWALGMIGEDQNEMVDIAIDWFANNYTWERNAGDYYISQESTAYYYYIYTMSKAIISVRDPQYKINGRNWVEDIKAALLDDNRMISVPDTDPAQVYWAGGGSLDGRNQLPTAYVLMSLAFADPGVESPKKLLAQPEDLDNPVRGQMGLEVRDGSLISNAERGRIDQASKKDSMGFPFGAFRFRISNIPGATTVLRIQLPPEAFNPENPDSFINKDGTIKRGFGWYSVTNPQWKAIGSVPVEIDADANLVRATLTDGGPEDQSGEAGTILIDTFSAVGYNLYEDIEIHLIPGWNLISLPLKPISPGIEFVLNDIAGKYSKVWAYENGEWKAHDPNPNVLFGELETMVDGFGYWIHMNQPAILTAIGDETQKLKNLFAGWNLVGYNSDSPIAIEDAMASIDRKYISVWAYENGSWKFYDPAHPGFSNLKQMKPGLGYWINASSGAQWLLP